MHSDSQLSAQRRSEKRRGLSIGAEGTLGDGGTHAAADSERGGGGDIVRRSEEGAAAGEQAVGAANPCPAPCRRGCTHT